MDAVSFVLGIQTSALRAHKITDFIYRSSDEVDAEIDKPMYVEIIFRKKNKNGQDLDVLVESESGEAQGKIEELSFIRSVSSKTGVSTYRVNGVKKTLAEYNQKLREIGLDIEIQNFLIFQGDVEGIVTITPKQRTNWFERISHSEDLKEEYEQLKEECEQNEYEANLTMTKKRAVSHEQRLYMMQKEESEKFQSLMEERVYFFFFRFIGYVNIFF